MDTSVSGGRANGSIAESAKLARTRRFSASGLERSNITVPLAAPAATGAEWARPFDQSVEFLDPRLLVLEERHGEICLSSDARLPVDPCGAAWSF